MAKYQFLSEDWFTEVQKIAGEAGGQPEGGHSAVTMNLVITDTPFGEDSQLQMGGPGGMARGHAENADVTLTTDYSTAKEVFFSGNPQAGMQAFMQGKIKVQGDMSKLMAAQGGGGNRELMQKIQEITE